MISHFNVNKGIIMVYPCHSKVVFYVIYDALYFFLIFNAPYIFNAGNWPQHSNQFQRVDSYQGVLVNESLDEIF